MRKELRLSLLLLGSASTVAPLLTTISCGTEKSKNNMSVTANIKVNELAGVNVTKSNFDTSEENVENDYPHQMQVNFDSKFYVGFKDSDLKTLLVKYKKYNRSWKFEFVNDKVNKEELINKIIHKIETNADFNNPSPEDSLTGPFLFDKKQIYMGYLYKRYNTEIWQNMYKDFSVLKQRFPFINVTYKHYDKGTWNSNLFSAQSMWSGLAEKSDVDQDKNLLKHMVNGVDVKKQDIANKTNIDYYEINIDGYIYKIVFDSDIPLKAYMKIKLITDLLSYKQWSFHILKYEGFTVGYKHLGSGGLATRNGGHMIPWGEIDAVDDFETLSDRKAYVHYESVYKLLEGMFHEFGHNETFTGNNTHAFIDGILDNRGTQKFFDMYKDKDRFTKITQNLHDTYNKDVFLDLSKIYEKWNPNPLFIDLKVSDKGSYHTYAYSNWAENATELERQFEEVPFYERTNFFNPDGAFHNGEVAQYTSYFEGYGIPIWDKDTREITKQGSLFRDQFYREGLGFDNKSLIFRRQVKNYYTQNNLRDSILGSVKSDFDFVRLHKDNDSDIISSTNIHKFGMNHSNWFHVNRFMTRDVTKLNTNKVPFVCLIGEDILHKWKTIGHYDAEFIKDNNHNNIYDAGDTIVDSQSLFG